MNHEQATHLMELLARFTNDGTPLQAVIGDKFELGVTLLTCAMVSNENLAACMEPDEQVRAAINYYNIIQEQIGLYKDNQAHSLEKLI
jgi:hypothetical protein